MLVILLAITPATGSPHTPHKVTWQIINTKSGAVLNQTSQIHPKDTWFPELRVDLLTLFPRGIYPDPFCKPAGIGQGIGDSKPLRTVYFYVCPEPSRTQSWGKNPCGDAGDYFCASWSCVSTGHIWWKAPRKGDLISVGRPSAPPCPRFGRVYCNPVSISFTEEGKKATGWDTGKTWGLRLYQCREFGTVRVIDPGVLFTLRVQNTPLHHHEPVGIGPNRILVPRPPQTTTPRVTTPRKTWTPASRPFSPLTPATGNLTLGYTSPSKEDPLWGIIVGAYYILNASRPDLTESCWLCLDAKPPYYEGVAIKGNYTAASTANSCRWQQTAAKLTLQAVTGQGTCIGNVPSEQSHLCNKTLATPRMAAYLLPPKNAWWACSSGLASCVHSLVLNSQKEGFCVLVQLIPKLIYHSGEEVLNRIDTINPRSKREPITALTVAALLGLGLAGTGTGISSLVIQDKNYGALRAAIDLDIERIEKSITHLQESLTSLSEVVLQNRRGLDLLFMQQGGLCTALGEECCFYVDHSGVVKESMALIREGLQKRKLERERSQSWYESLFNWSPWLTTLISALIGPLTILLMLLTFGPCIINKLVRFVKERIGVVQLMVLQAQYRPLAMEDGVESSPSHD